MKIVLTIDNKEVIFSEQELTEIVKQHLFQSECIFPNRIVENTWFDVDPTAINKRLFENERNDKAQETMRIIINAAFKKVDEYPEQYKKRFKTKIPEKTWNEKNILQLKQTAYAIGDSIADWVEQALEWAQRINNGESWETLCNKPDASKWFRLVIWGDGNPRIIGGSTNDCCEYPPTLVSSCNKSPLNNTVPLVVKYHF